MKKILVICGPTATGKTSLGIRLAKKFHGEIISADSRQVYKGMDIGTGKDLPVNSKLKTQNSKLQLKIKKFNVGYRLKNKIPIWLVDIVEPSYHFNIGEYTRLAQQVIKYLWKKGKLPIIVGGTGLYIKALKKPLNKTNIPPDKTLRKKLANQDVNQLQKMLSKINPRAFEKMNYSDQHNPRRLTRAIEIESVNNNSAARNIDDYYQDLNILIIGLTTDKSLLFKKIDQRVEKRVKQGVVKEIRSLLDKGYSWDLPAISALGYKEWREYFSEQYAVSSMQQRKRELKQKIIEKWKLHEKQYAKRQMTWFKKEKNTIWFDISIKNYSNKVINKVGVWYDKFRN